MSLGFYLEIVSLALIIILGIWETRTVRQKDFLFHRAEFVAFGFSASDVSPVKFSMA